VAIRRIDRRVVEIGFGRDLVGHRSPSVLVGCHGNRFTACVAIQSADATYESPGPQRIGTLPGRQCGEDH
jgi:hypothetical protein